MAHVSQMEFSNNGYDGGHEQSPLQQAGAQMWTQNEMGAFNMSRRTTSDINTFDFSSALGDMSFYRHSQPSYADAIPQGAAQRFRRGEVRSNNALGQLDEALQDIQNGDFKEAKGDLIRALRQLFLGRRNFAEGAQGIGDTQEHGDRVTDIGEGRLDLKRAGRDIFRALQELKRGDESKSMESIREAIGGILGGIGKVRSGVDGGLVDLAPGTGRGGNDYGYEDEADWLD
jgi:hypothetical protein